MVSITQPLALTEIIIRSCSLTELFTLANVSSGQLDHLIIPELIRRHVRTIRPASLSGALVIDFGLTNDQPKTIFDVRYQ